MWFWGFLIISKKISFFGFHLYLYWFHPTALQYPRGAQEDYCKAQAITSETKRLGLSRGAPLMLSYETINSNDENEDLTSAAGALEVSACNLLGGDSSPCAAGDSVIEGGGPDMESLELESSSSSMMLQRSYSSHWSAFSCGTNVSIVANTVNALLGVSIFAMPWGFEQAGLVGGALTICLVAPLSYETARVLLVAQRMIYHSTGVVKNYPEIASDILGKKWAIVVKVATVVSCLGGCVGYLIFLGEVCGQLFDLPLETAIQGAVIPLMILSWIRSFRDLAIFTLIRVVAIIVSCIVVMIDGLHAMKLQLPNSSHPHLLTLSSAPNFLGPATFLYTIHYCVLSMGAETLLQHDSLPSERGSSGAMSINSSPTERRKATSANSAHNDSSISRPLAISYALSSLLIILVGSSGYFTYGSAAIVRDGEGNPQPGCENHVCQNIIMNLSAGPLRDFAGFALVVAIVLSYVIILVPAREHIELFIIRLVPPSVYAAPHHVNLTTTTTTTTPL